MAGFRHLASEVRRAGLMQRRRGREVTRIIMTAAAFAGGWVTLALVGGTWAAVIGVAAYLGAVSAHIVFIGHDAGHRQIFRSRRANRAVGLVAGNLLTGLSFGWWVPKHAAHHAYPNQIGRDPDVAPGIIAWTPEDPLSQSPPRRAFLRWQAPLLFPLMLLQVVPMRLASGRSMRERADRTVLIEAGLIALHAAAYLSLVFFLLPPIEALAFIGIQQAAFGLYLGLSFVPNHVGRPILEEGTDASFAQRQIVTSRHVTGGPLVTFLLGGLDLQIEHHLFPTMPRSNLRRAQPLVRAYCASQGWHYQQDSLPASYRQALRNLWATGHGRWANPRAGDRWEKAARWETGLEGHSGRPLPGRRAMAET
jgi:fatty acid desaturase